MSLPTYVYDIYVPLADLYFRPNPSIYDIGGLGRLVSEESLHRGQRSKRQITITMRIDFSPCNDFNFPSTAPGLDVNELHQARFTNGHVPTHTRN